MSHQGGGSKNQEIHVTCFMDNPLSVINQQIIKQSTTVVFNLRVMAPKWGHEKLSWDHRVHKKIKLIEYKSINKLFEKKNVGF